MPILTTILLSALSLCVIRSIDYLKSLERTSAGNGGSRFLWTEGSARPDSSAQPTQVGQIHQAMPTASDHAPTRRNSRVIHCDSLARGKGRASCLYVNEVAKLGPELSAQRHNRFARIRASFASTLCACSDGLEALLKSRCGEGVAAVSPIHEMHMRSVI